MTRREKIRDQKALMSLGWQFFELFTKKGGIKIRTGFAARHKDLENQYQHTNFEKLLTEVQKIKV